MSDENEPDGNRQAIHADFERMLTAAIAGDEEAQDLVLLALATGRGRDAKRWRLFEALLNGPKKLPTEAELNRRMMAWARRPA